MFRWSDFLTAPLQKPQRSPLIKNRYVSIKVRNNPVNHDSGKDNNDEKYKNKNCGMDRTGIMDYGSCADSCDERV